MNVLKLKKIALALGSLALAGTATQAMALPSFTINPNAIPGTTGLSPQVADFVTGTSTELLTVTGPSTLSGSGYIYLQGFSYQSAGVFGTGLGSTYGLYIKFDFTDTLTSGAIGGANSTYALNSLNFSLYADPGGGDTFTQASTTTSTHTATSITDVGSNDVLLGFGSLVSGVAGFNSQGGAALNSTETFALCSGMGTAVLGTTTVSGAGCTGANGTSYFTAPVPFYSFAFDEFNNTSTGVSQTTADPMGSYIAIVGASGGINFAVPEPDSLALFGVAAVAAGLAARRRRKA